MSSENHAVELSAPTDKSSTDEQLEGKTRNPDEPPDEHGTHIVEEVIMKIIEDAGTDHKYEHPEISSADIVHVERMVSCSGTHSGYTVSETSVCNSNYKESNLAGTTGGLNVHLSQSTVSSVSRMITSPTSNDYSSDTSYSSGSQLGKAEVNLQRRTPKRTQDCVTKTVSITIEVPHKKFTESDQHDADILDDGINEVETLASAIARKYVNNAMLHPEEDLPPNIVIISAPRDCLPATLVLNDSNISSVGDLHDVQSMCHLVRELDLAQNNITDLCEVQKILNSMQRLSFLNLSCNDLSRCGRFPTGTVTITTMKWLVLNGTRLSWEAVETMLEVMPNLEELYLSLNGYTSVQLNKNKLPSVHVVHISGNPIASWDDIQVLGQKFPNLDTLVMTDCLVSGFTNEENIGAIFENLQSLNMSNNQISKWSEIDKLLHFSALTDLRLLGQPLLEDYSQQERRQLMVGRLPNVERLNGSQISEQEREDAERAFIRYYMEKERKQRPRRYSQLVKKHGKLDPLVTVDLRPKTVVQVLLKYEERKAIRAVNVYQTVASLKASFQDFTGLVPTHMRVFYIDKEIEGFQVAPDELRYNSKMLYTYNLQDGDEFHIIEKATL